MLQRNALRAGDEVEIGTGKEVLGVVVMIEGIVTPHVMVAEIVTSQTGEIASSAIVTMIMNPVRDPNWSSNHVHCPWTDRRLNRHPPHLPVLNPLILPKLLIKRSLKSIPLVVPDPEMNLNG
jgi:hypothetical protein